MKATLLTITAAAALALLPGAAPLRAGDDGPCDLSSVRSGFWCPPCEKAFEPDAVSNSEYTCPDCGRTLEVCDVCLKRVPEGDRERADVARVVYRCQACGALGDSEGPCPSCDGCGRMVRACSKSGAAPHAGARHDPT